MPALPLDQQPPEHGDRPATADLSETPVNAQLLICHPHVHLIQLRTYILRSRHPQNIQMGGNCGIFKIKWHGYSGIPSDLDGDEQRLQSQDSQ